MMNAAENKGVDTTVATDSDTNTNSTTPTTDNNNTPSSNNTNNNDNNNLITNPINEGEDVKWIFVSATSGSVAKQFQFKNCWFDNWFFWVCNSNTLDYITKPNRYTFLY